MINLNKNIDNDISYLLAEIGHNVKINNVSSSAIINNSDLERTFDDKRIITGSKLKRGNYIKYNDLNFIVLNEINDKRYKSYFKGIMRNCNHDIKFIIENKLYLFYATIETQKGQVVTSNNIISIANDDVVITLPDTEVTRKIDINDRFFFIDKTYKIQHTDYTQKGLIRLNCKRDQVIPADDDKENEIADRYKEGKDKLEGNIIPIYPYDASEEPQPKPIIVKYIDTEGLELKESVTLTGGIGESYKATTEEIEGYELTETPTNIEGVFKNVEQEVIFIYSEIPVVAETYIELEGDDKVNAMNDGTITAIVFIDGVESDETVTFSLSNKLASISSQDGKKCTLKANKNWNFGEVILTATLDTDETITAEKVVHVTGL